MAKDDDTGTLSEAERRRRSKEAASRLPMRDEDWDAMRGIRVVSMLLKSVAVILILVMIMQIYFTLTDPSGMPVTPGTIMGEAVRLLAFAAFLGGRGPGHDAHPVPSRDARDENPDAAAEQPAVQDPPGREEDE